jgi:hypothetical protein
MMYKEELNNLRNINIDYKPEHLNPDQGQNEPKTIHEDDVDIFIKQVNKYISMPKRDGETIACQFFPDKAKRRLVTKNFVDPITNVDKGPQTKVEYQVIDPVQADQGEKLLDVPKTVAQQIEANIVKGHYLLEITRHGTGTNTRYTVIAS